MTIAVLTILYASIIVLWFLVGRYEWRVPFALRRGIIAFLRKREKEAVESLVLKIEAREFITADLEKEIYIVKKARSGSTDNIVMNVGIPKEIDVPVQTEYARTKQRLERRFPGLTINFAWEEKEKAHAVSCIDR